MLNLVAACKTSRSETESNSVPVRVAKRRDRQSKSANQSLQPSASSGLKTQQASSPKSYNLRSRKN